MTARSVSRIEEVPGILKLGYLVSAVQTVWKFGGRTIGFKWLGVVVVGKGTSGTQDIQDIPEREGSGEERGLQIWIGPEM